MNVKIEGVFLLKKLLRAVEGPLLHSLSEDLDVGSRAESPVPSPEKEGKLKSILRAGLIQGLADQSHHLGCERIDLVRPVQNDGHHSFRALHKDFRFYLLSVERRGILQKKGPPVSEIHKKSARFKRQLKVHRCCTSCM